METIFHSGTRVFYIAAGGRGVLVRVLNVYSFMYLVVYLVVVRCTDMLVGGGQVATQTTGGKGKAGHGKTL